ncbi:hypothetical protein ANN_11474 [Periplaneta americana]|uniref:Uncharacterized protein n=1 Tax=Periplaneta americana TaxID=6978 RepID=A0ABQ8T6M9_PERAM|nr:hypothetical protein ANN_11474 [Periplaneta americana]
MPVFPLTPMDEYQKLEYNKDPPTFKTIKERHGKFLANDSVLKGHGGGNPGVQKEAIENVWISFERSPRIERTWNETVFVSKANSDDVRRVQRCSLTIFAVKKPCTFKSTGRKPSEELQRCSFGEDRRRQTVALQKGGTTTQHRDLISSIALILKLGTFPNPHRLTTLRFAASRFLAGNPARL